MSYRKPFRAVPIKPGKIYCEKQKRQMQKRQNVKIAGPLIGAAWFGGVIGAGSLAINQDTLTSATNTAKEFAISQSMIRAREPQEGDYWAGCNAARAAGTAPIYRHEPGYREGMDGDGDGIACENY